MSSVHIVYLTSECNFDCEYCFEQNKSKHINLNKSDIDRIVKDAVNEDGQTLFSLFGGEPLLKYDLIEYLMKKSYSLKHDIHFQIISNGYRFLDNDFLFKYYKNPFVQKGFVTLAISYDGIGQSLRTFKKKDTSKDLLKVFNRLKRLNLKYEISYTVNRLNVHNAYSDLIKIYNILKPTKILINIDRHGISDKDYNNFIISKNELKKDICVCFFDCNECTLCDERKSTRKYYINDVIKTVNNSENVGVFNDF